MKWRVIFHTRHQRSGRCVMLSLLSLFSVMCVFVEQHAMAEILPEREAEESLEVRHKSIQHLCEHIARFQWQQQFTPQLLHELSRIVVEEADDLWLTALHYHGRQVDMEGITRGNPALAHYLRCLEASEYFEQTEFYTGRDEGVILTAYQPGTIHDEEVRKFMITAFLAKSLPRRDLSDPQEHGQSSSCRITPQCKRFLEEYDQSSSLMELRYFLTEQQMPAFSVERIVPRPHSILQEYVMPIETRGAYEEFVHVAERVAQQHYLLNIGAFSLMANDDAELTISYSLYNLLLDESQGKVQIPSTCWQAVETGSSLSPKSTGDETTTILDHNRVFSPQIQGRFIPVQKEE